MNEPCDVSVNICTYNRCSLLAGALESILAQRTSGLRYEVVVVDNNSTDQTRQVIESFIARGHSNVRYVFEKKQGLSHARNAGITNARADIIALTDDDVRVNVDWVLSIKDALDRHPEVDCVGGKVLPRWRSSPPAWLTRAHWAPLALVDYGDEPFYVSAAHQICLITANLAMRRKALEDIGLFSPSLQRVKDVVGSMEDHELLVRFWNTGRQGLYDPKLVVSTDVPSERLSKTYHRRWHSGHGHFYAIARLEEMERTSLGRLFDVPAHAYRTALIEGARLLKALARGDIDGAFTSETNILYFVGFFSKRYKDFADTSQRGAIREIARFVKSLRRRRSAPTGRSEPGMKSNRQGVKDHA